MVIIGDQNNTDVLQTGRLIRMGPLLVQKGGWLGPSPGSVLIMAKQFYKHVKLFMNNKYVQL